VGDLFVYAQGRLEQRRDGDLFDSAQGRLEQRRDGDLRPLQARLENLERETEELNSLINQAQVEEISEDSEPARAEVSDDSKDREENLYIEPLEDFD
ncbi:MAG: hypothetical protein HY397_03550, partial [Candidatus Doudnabacteria bacterium]|nr:hypothetical protein [Candidatus Doudnabacteria bacterium]